MKKLILASAMMMGFISFSFAQTATTKEKKPAKAKTEASKPAAKSDAAATPAKADKSAAKATPAKAPAAATAAPAADKNGTVLKKDGTPDKRYKAAKPAKGPVKKDGTPDKRYKENKKP